MAPTLGTALAAAVALAGVASGERLGSGLSDGGNWRRMRGVVERPPAHGGRALPPVTMTMEIPFAGSLQHISGTVTGLANPQDYRFCVYLQSRVNSYNGPKPAEDNGSFSPIDANGNFNYVNWWANNVFDVISPTVYGFIWPNARGNCLPTVGGPAIPQGMYDNSAVWMKKDRVVSMALDVTTPFIRQDGPVEVDVSGIPAGETVDKYKALIYVRTAGGLAGPMPLCTSVHDLVADAADPTKAHVSIADWHANNAAYINTATNITVALIPAPYVPAGEQCIGGAAAIPVSAPTIVVASVNRIEEPPSPSGTPTPSITPSASPSPSPSPSPISQSPAPGTGTGTGGTVHQSSGASTLGTGVIALSLVLAAAVLAYWSGNQGALGGAHIHHE